MLQDGRQIFQNEVVCLLSPLFRQLVKQLGRFREVAQSTDGFFLNGSPHLLASHGAFVDLVKLDTVVLQNLIREQLHAFRQILVEDEAKDAVPEFIGPRLSSQSVGDVSKLGLKLFLGSSEMENWHVSQGHRLTGIT